MVAEARRLWSAPRLVCALVGAVAFSSGNVRHATLFAFA